MAAYIVAQVKVRDPAAYQRYREAVTPLVDRFGGRFRVRGGELDVLEGDWPFLASSSSRSRARTRRGCSTNRPNTRRSCRCGRQRPMPRWPSSRACEPTAAGGRSAIELKDM